MTIISTFMTMMATCVIAYYALENHRLTKSLISKDDEFKQELRDLYKAIVVSNLCKATSDADIKKREFESMYDGKTPILKEYKPT